MCYSLQLLFKTFSAVIIARYAQSAEKYKQVFM